MENNNVLPIQIVIELKSEIPFQKIIYQTEKSHSKSVIDCCNNQSNKPEQSFESQLGERVYKSLSIVTLTTKDLSTINDMMDSGDKSMISDCDIINFTSGNPANEITEGIIHYYKDEKNCLFNNRQKIATHMLCMISVPRSMSIRDILDFTASYRDYIDEMKVVKDNTPNEYIVLLKFGKTDDADNFYRTFNNVKFNSLESSVCHLVYVSLVESLASSSTTRFPLQGLTELPTCPVCLERLDEPLNGILAIVCNHIFHSKCIQQMNESTCPVCRYPQTPQVMSDKYKCGMCDKREDLWLCLICAHTGCGRQENKHAEQHFYETGHLFAMKIGTRDVWDYAADTRVHRLVANTSDGKPVEVDGEDPDDKKMTNICMEYTGLLAEQLSAQRTYLENEYCEKLSVLEYELQRQNEIAKESHEHLQLVLKEKSALDKRLNQLSLNYQKLQKQYNEEFEMNKSLREKQTSTEKQLKSKEEQLKDKEEQLNDLMLNLQMADKITEAQNRGELNEDEVKNASLSVGPGSNNLKNRRNKRK